MKPEDEVHYAMPVKNMVYDALEYAGQVRKAASSHRKAKDAKEHSAGEYLSGFYKEDRLVPVSVLDRKAAMVINVCTNSKLKIDPNQEVVDMCKAIADMRSEERTEGRREGVKEGALEANKATALRMLKKGGFSYEMVAEIAGLTLEEVKVLAGKN